MSQYVKHSLLIATFSFYSLCMDLYMYMYAGILCQLKRCTDMRFKFYLGQNEDCSPGDGTSDSSERLLQRGSGEGQ